MKDIAKEVMNSVPQYLINFYKLFGSPRQFPVQHLPADEHSTKSALTDALKFMLISLVLIILLNYYRLDKQTVTNIYSELAAFSIAIVVVMSLFSLCIYSAWRLFGTRRKFTDYFIIYSYNFGVVFVLIFVSILVADGYLKTNDPAAFAQLMADKKAGIAFSDNLFQNPNILAAFFIMMAGYFFAVVWAWIGWGAYRIINNASRFRTFLAMVVASLFSSLAAWFTQMLLAGMGMV